MIKTQAIIYSKHRLSSIELRKITYFKSITISNNKAAYIWPDSLMLMHAYKILIASYNTEIYFSAVILQFDPFNCNASAVDAILA
jgi:hypothetical protein